MSWLGWCYYLLSLMGCTFLSTWKLYRAAGKCLEAAVPIYNAIVLMEIIRPLGGSLMLIPSSI